MFNYSYEDESCKLGQSALDLLEEMDALPYGALVGFSSLGDLHQTVDVIVVKDAQANNPRRRVLTLTLADLRGLIEEWQHHNDDIHRQRKNLQMNWNDLNEEEQEATRQALDELERELLPVWVLQEEWDKHQGESDNTIITVDTFADIKRLGYYTRGKIATALCFNDGSRGLLLYERQ